MLKALFLSLFLILSWTGVAEAKAACEGLKRKDCAQAVECRWQKAKKACTEKKLKKSAKVKKKATKKPDPAPAKEAATDDFSTESEDVDTSLDEF